MNLLSGSRRSIVSDVEGTTRDIVEETVNLCGAVLLIADCAGIRETEDEVEKIGVQIMLEKLRNADIVLAVFDGSRRLSDEDWRLFGLLKDKVVIPVVNKNDLENVIEIEELESRLGKAVTVSAKDEGCADVLGREIASRLDLDSLNANSGFLANERQRACVIRAAAAVDNALSGTLAGITPDAVGVDLEQALDAVYELSGRKASEEVIAEVFKRFCVGK